MQCIFLVPEGRFFVAGHTLPNECMEKLFLNRNLNPNSASTYFSFDLGGRIDDKSLRNAVTLTEENIGRFSHFYWLRNQQ